VAGLLQVLVEELLPLGGRAEQLCWPGGFRVVGGDACGGPPDGDVSHDAGVDGEALGWQPRRLGGFCCCLGSDLFGEVGDELGALSEVWPPGGMLVEWFGDAG
jgi:hypothetical protein